jgi:hypothetical protein
MDQKMAQALYDQAMDLWVHPEIKERHQKGMIATLPFVLKAAQIIFGVDGSYKVRLNGEVKGKIIGKYTRAIKAGEAVTYNDVENLHLAERDPKDLDFGHITLISQGDNKWSISFDFNYGVENSKGYLNLGKEYLGQAKKALNSSRRTSLVLATTAGENLMKARLATSPLIELKTKTHAGVINLLGRFTKMPNKKQISPEYNNAIKFFHKHFNGVRYDPGYAKVHKSTIKKNLNILDRLYSETYAMIANVDMYSLNQRQIRIKPQQNDDVSS